MEKKLILENLNQLIITWNEGNEEEKVLNEMELLLESYLVNHPNDEDMLIKLALVEFTIPLADYGRLSTIFNELSALTQIILRLF